MSAGLHSESQNLLVPLLDQRLCVSSKGDFRKPRVCKLSLHEDQSKFLYPQHRVHVVQLVKLTHLCVCVCVLEKSEKPAVTRNPRTSNLTCQCSE